MEFMFTVLPASPHNFPQFQQEWCFPRGAASPEAKDRTAEEGTCQGGQKNNAN